MEVSGYEVFLVVLYSPLFVELTFIRKTVMSRNGRALFLVLTLASLSSFHLPSTLSRLVVLSLGNFSAMLLFTNLLMNPSQSERCVIETIAQTAHERSHHLSTTNQGDRPWPYVCGVGAPYLKKN